VQCTARLFALPSQGSSHLNGSQRGHRLPQEVSVLGSAPLYPVGRCAKAARLSGSALSALGKRDYAILLLLVTYGLRACEVANLKLDDIDWKRERLMVSERKAGHNTAYPLSSAVGEAIIDYLKHGRPPIHDRHLFLRAMAPRLPMASGAVSNRVTNYLHKAGIAVGRPGSHTLRHTCVQRLVDAEFSFKAIGDYGGHASPASTQIYTKVAVETLREVALGHGEELP